MKEGGWADCLETQNALKIGVDKAKIRSLIDTAHSRILFLKRAEFNEETARFIFEGYYSSALEIAHALLLARGYKASNHVCIGFFLRDVMNSDTLFRIFDDSRYARNAIVYYGKNLDFEETKTRIEKLKRFIKDTELLCKIAA